MIESAPIDLALAPLHPIFPKVLLWGVLGFLLGGSLGSLFVFGKGLVHGLEATDEHLSAMGYPVLGHLNSIENLETLRRLQAYFDPSMEAKGVQQLLLLQGEGPDYTSELADLFLKRGKKVLTIDLRLNDPAKIATRGLTDYLAGKIQHLPKRLGKHGDWIAAGSATRYGIELINSHAFKSLLTQLEGEYDWILLNSGALPTSSEGEILLSIFPNAAITLTHETLEDLKQVLCPLDHHFHYKYAFLRF